VPYGDINMLAARILYVLDNPGEAAQLGMAARHKCVRDYSWEAMERVLLKVFSEYDQ
jgi:glycosyltransferase involved in cell wall biosynthesis